MFYNDTFNSNWNKVLAVLLGIDFCYNCSVLHEDAHIISLEITHTHFFHCFFTRFY
jgi:hypothetical protein